MTWLVQGPVVFPGGVRRRLGTDGRRQEEGRQGQDLASQWHRCHTFGPPTGIGLPSQRSGLEPGRSRRRYPRSGSDVPASHGNPLPCAGCRSAPFSAAYGLVTATGSGSIRVQLDVAGVNHQEPELLHSNSGSSITASRRSFQTPGSRQRQKRRWVFFQSLKSGCRSRQCLPCTRYGSAPVRRFQNTSFRNNRLSLPGRPFSLGHQANEVQEIPKPGRKYHGADAALPSPTPHVHFHIVNTPSYFDFEGTAWELFAHDSCGPCQAQLYLSPQLKVT